MRHGVHITKVEGTQLDKSIANQKARTLDRLLRRRFAHSNKGIVRGVNNLEKYGMKNADALVTQCCQTCVQTKETKQKTTSELIQGSLN